MKGLIKIKLKSLILKIILYPFHLIVSLTSWVLIGTLLDLVGVDNAFSEYFYNNILSDSSFTSIIVFILIIVAGVFSVRLGFWLRGKSTSYEQYHPEYEKPEISLDADVYDSDYHKIGTASYHQDGDSGIRKHLTGWGFLSYLLLPCFAITKAIAIVAAIIALFIPRLFVSACDYLGKDKKQGMFYSILFYVFDISILD